MINKNIKSEIDKEFNNINRLISKAKNISSKEYLIKRLNFKTKQLMLKHYNSFFENPELFNYFSSRKSIIERRVMNK